METRLPSIVDQLLSKQWEFMKLSASFLSIAVIAILMPLMTVLFAGSISQAHLDGVGLATTMFNVLVISMSAGYSSVFDTYGPQVYGSSKRSELGTVVIKCLLQGGLVNLVILGPYLNFVYVIDMLPASVTESDVNAEGFRDIAVQYLRLIVMVEFLDYTVLMISKYFAIQGHSRFVYMVSVIMIVSYILANYLLVSTLELGVNGLGLAAIIGRIIPLLVSLIICIAKIRTKEFIWTGFGFKALLGWKPMIKLGVSGAMNCFAELALYEISTFCSQFDGTTSFSVIIIITQLLNFCWALTEGIARAGATLIGSALGDGNADNVKLYIVLTILNTLLECIPLAVTCFFLRTHLVKMFNPGEDVVDLFVDTFWIACISLVIYHFQNGLNQGVLVAFGEQKFIAWSTSIACYGVGLPIVIITIFFTDLKVIGIIVGWMVSDLIIITAALFKISRINISKEIERTELRVATNSLQVTDDCVKKGFDNPAYHVEDEHLQINTIECTVAEGIEEGIEEGVTYGISSGETLEPNIVGFNQEIKNVLIAFLISAIVCVILAGISLLRH